MLISSSAGGDEYLEHDEAAASLGVPIDESVPPLVCLGLSGAVSQLTHLRTGIRTWASGAGMSVDDTADLVLATYEALTNAAEHAYRSGAWTVDLVAARTPDARIVVSVRDRGQWRPPPEDPGFRGRGLSMMRSLAHELDVRADDDGTTVLMWWALPAERQP
ncbi:MAG TPA: ATP-binding protein [Pseudonocardia sp.]|nr:ATP-binding protein [Pseudonocardia sp.]